MPSKDRNEKAAVKKQAEDNGHKIGKFGQPAAPPAETTEYHVAYCTICQESVVASLTTDGRWLRGGTALDKVCISTGNDGIQAVAQKLVEEKLVAAKPVPAKYALLAAITGEQIADCLCDQIDLSDRPCIVCDAVTNRLAGVEAMGHHPDAAGQCISCHQKLSDLAPIRQECGERTALMIYDTPCPALLALETQAAWQAALTIPKCDISAPVYRLLLAIGSTPKPLEGESGAPGDHFFEVTFPEGTMIEKISGVKDHVKDVIIYSPPSKLLTGLGEGAVLALGWFAEEQIGDIPQLFLFTSADRLRAYQRERIEAYEEHQRIEEKLKTAQTADGSADDRPQRRRWRSPMNIAMAALGVLPERVPQQDRRACSQGGTYSISANGEIEDVSGAPTPPEAGFTHDIAVISAPRHTIVKTARSLGKSDLTPAQPAKKPRPPKGMKSKGIKLSDKDQKSRKKQRKSSEKARKIQRQRRK